ncbi:MAG: DUF1440 domain-containing protein [Chloroflexota bacterium]
MAVAMVGGFVATKAMEPVTTALYGAESEADRERERQVSPGVPYRVAAEKVTRRLGLRLSDPQLDRAGLIFHYGLGVGWAPLYAVLRRRWRVPAPQAGIATGLALFAIVDEGLNPIIGSSAPPQAHPVASHVRGFVGHLAYGLALAAAVEAIWLLLDRRSRP